jgi:hypothetical protein
MDTIEFINKYLEKDLDVDLNQLHEFDSKKKTLDQMDIHSGPEYIQAFLNAYDIVAGFVLRVEKAYGNAVSHRKEEESRAILERAYPFFEARGILKEGRVKDSGTLRESYRDLDPIVMTCRERETMLKAFLAYLYDKKESYIMAHYDAKQIFQSLMRSPSIDGYSGMSSRGKIGDIG